MTTCRVVSVWLQSWEPLWTRPRLCLKLLRSIEMSCSLVLSRSCRCVLARVTLPAITFYVQLWWAILVLVCLRLLCISILLFEKTTSILEGLIRGATLLLSIPRKLLSGTLGILGLMW